MNHRPECIPCSLRRVLHAAAKTTGDDWLHRKILGEAMQLLGEADDKSTPAEVIHGLLRRSGKTLGASDPYLEERSLWVSDTKGNTEWIESVVAGAEDPFVAALHLAVAANILDCDLRQDIVGSNFSLKSLVEGYSSVPFPQDNVPDFRQAVNRASRVLFIHDSAGELFFDKLLIERFEKPAGSVVSVVRETPILSDATREDAEAVGLDTVAEIVTPGLDCLGIPLNLCSEEFREHYRAADLIVAKGQANCETLEGKDARIDGGERELFFLLRAKCRVMARHLGVSVGDCVLEVG